MNNIISTKVVINRNLKDYKFCSKLTKAKANEIVNIVKSSLPDFVEASNEDFRVLLENDLVQNPERIILFNQKNMVAITLFEGEHLSIVATHMGYNSLGLNSAKMVAETLSNKITMAYNDQYGYLMSDVSKIGSGVHLESEISLPAINSLGKVQQLAQNITRLGFKLEKTNQKDIFVLSTKCNLGMTEKEIYDEFDKMLTRIQDLELESLNLIKIESIDELTDEFYRSASIIKYAHMIDASELYDCLIMIQTGLNLGLEMNLFDAEKLTKLFALARFYAKKSNDKQNRIALAQEVAKLV